MITSKHITWYDRVYKDGITTILGRFSREGNQIIELRITLNESSACVLPVVLSNEGKILYSGQPFSSLVDATFDLLDYINETYSVRVSL